MDSVIENIVVPENKKETAVDFFDINQGLACWKSGRVYSGNIYTAYAKIRVFLTYEDYISVDRLREFIKTLFETNELFEEFEKSPLSFTFTVLKKDISLKDDAEKLLTKCTLLNTYREYFTATTGISKIKILYSINLYDSREDMDKSVNDDIISNEKYIFPENIAINDVVFENTGAKEELGQNATLLDVSPAGDKHRWYAYNLFFSKISENLRNELKAY